MIVIDDRLCGPHAGILGDGNETARVGHHGTCGHSPVVDVGDDRNVVAYVSMAFGNPYGEAWSLDEVLQACDLIAECGILEISLADTVGLATTDQIEEVLSAVIGQFTGLEIGAHLHARPAEAAPCRPFRGLRAYVSPRCSLHLRSRPSRP